MLANLPNILLWHDLDAVLADTRTAREAHLGLLVRRLRVLLESVDAHELMRALVALPALQAMRIFEAPETCRRIHLAISEGVEQLCAFLWGALELEQRLLDDGASARGGWTALGDHQLPDPSQLETERYAAPTVHGLIIDIASPYANRELVESNFRPKFGHGARFDGPELGQVLFRVQAAVEGLCQSSAPAFAFVEALVRTIMPRKDQLTPTFKGSSNFAEIGRVNLFNPQLDIVDHSAIACSLLHEAVHTYLYICEERRPFVTRPELAHASRIESPWSDKQIHLRAYLHAMIVWYALHQFWAPPARLEQFSAPVREHFLTLTRRGFVDGAALARLRPFWSDIDEELFVVLVDVQLEMERHG